MPLERGRPAATPSWRPITRLAKWAEPSQNHPVAPFRWVGYDGDAGHGCGNHLHLSWDHAPARSYTLAEWVETFPVGAPTARPTKKAAAAQAEAPNSPPARPAATAPRPRAASPPAGD